MAQARTGGIVLALLFRCRLGSDSSIIFFRHGLTHASLMLASVVVLPARHRHFPIVQREGEAAQLNVIATCVLTPPFTKGSPQYSAPSCAAAGVSTKFKKQCCCSI